MSKSLQQYQQRHQGLNAYGKELTRRSGACCELCHTCSVKLVIFEVPPIPPEPDLAHCVFLCERCLEQIEKPKRRDPNYWHFLSKAVWSPVPSVQVIAVWMARQLSPLPWVDELLEQLYLDPEVEDWLNSIPS